MVSPMLSITAAVAWTSTNSHQTCHSSSVTDLTLNTQLLAGLQEESGQSQCVTCTVQMSALQKLKYHIQTSGRSLHAQEIDFNDIRTTLQALLAIQDNANSLHTNAYDEAITTPTEESVARTSNPTYCQQRNPGWTKTENPMQGSFIVDELTDLVEAAVLEEFEAISRRGVCSVLWRPCINVVRSKMNQCIMST